MAIALGTFLLVEHPFLLLRERWLAHGPQRGGVVEARAAGSAAQ